MVAKICSFFGLLRVRRVTRGDCAAQGTCHAGHECPVDVPMDQPNGGQVPLCPVTAQSREPGLVVSLSVRRAAATIYKGPDAFASGPGFALTVRAHKRRLFMQFFGNKLADDLAQAGQVRL